MLAGWKDVGWQGARSGDVEDGEEKIVRPFVYDMEIVIVVDL